MAGGHLQAGNQLPGEPYLWASSINDASIETLKDGIQRASRWADMCHVGRGEHRKRTWELCALPSTLFCAPCPFTIDGGGDLFLRVLSYSSKCITPKEGGMGFSDL